MSKTLLNIRLIITLFPNLAPNLLGAFPLRRAGPGLRALGRPAYVAGAASPGVRDTVHDTNNIPIGSARCDTASY
jgi:hypothetical protein